MKQKINKVFRDPIHGYIHVYEKEIYQLIETKAMQRLKRIYQLGGSFQVFPTAEHSRFSHAIGAYQIASRIINEVEGVNKNLNGFEQVLLKVAVLLHDLGHGPFSHAFEMIHSINHETYTKEIILNDLEVNKILVKINPKMPQALIEVYDGKYKNQIINQLVSSQIDADRMDYLLRDAYFCGTPYGSFDIGRILRVMSVDKKRIVFKESGIPAIEDYLVGRYHMYQQVYLHPRSLGFELLMVGMINRFIDLRKQNFKFKNDYRYFDCLVSGTKIKIQDYHNLDDNLLYFYAKQFGEESDSIIKELSQRFINRRLLNYRYVNSDKLADTLVKEFGFSKAESKYFVYKEHVIADIYKKYDLNNNQEILVLNPDKRIVSLVKASKLVAALDKESQLKSDNYLVFFKS
jgi:HD superfamily phosphohydrolase